MTAQVKNGIKHRKLLASMKTPVFCRNQLHLDSGYKAPSLRSVPRPAARERDGGRSARHKAHGTVPCAAFRSLSWAHACCFLGAHVKGRDFAKCKFADMFGTSCSTGSLSFTPGCLNAQSMLIRILLIHQPS